MRVRLACHRCGSNGDAVAIAEFAAERVSTRLRLDAQAQRDKLVELNVRESVAQIAATPILSDAWNQGWPVEIHGMIYSLVDGQLTLLESSSRTA